MGEVRTSRAADLPAIRALLADAGLPVEGVDALGEDLIVTEERGRVVGAVGMERRGDVALLRSLVVDPTLRACGIGATLCDALLTRAAAADVREVWLLTETAEPFFRRHGFETVSRDAAPEAIRRTDEFSRICPGSATIMRKRVG